MSDLILDDAVVVGADVIGAGESIDELYQGGITLCRHFLFSENELIGFLKLRDARAKSQNKQPKQIPEGWKLIGKVSEMGVVWYKQNPHAHPVGTEFYAVATTSLTRETNTEVEDE